MSSVEFLQTYSDYIKHANLFTWIWSYVTWGLTKFFYFISSASEGLIDDAFKVFGYLEGGRVGAIYAGVQRISWTVLAITVIYIGYKMIIGKKVKIKDSLIYVVILTSLMVNMPGIINKAVELNQKLYSESKNLVVDDSTDTDKNHSVSFNIIRSNVADLEFLAEEGFSKMSNPDRVKNPITEENFKYIDFQQILLPGDVKDLAKKTGNEDAKHLEKYIAVDSKGEMKEEKIKNGWFTLFEEGTFRYGARHGAMNVSFIVLSIFFFMQFCKLIIILIDLVHMKIYAPLVLASDIETAKKSKQMMLDIFGAVFSISALGISTVLFTGFYSYLVGLRLDIIPFFLIGVVGAVGFIKGSDSVAKYFGINTSVKDGVIGAMGMLGAMKAGQMLGKGASEIPGAVSNGMSKAKDIGQKSYQKASEGIQKSAESMGKTAGQISERGFGGAMKDKLSDTKDNTVNKAKEMATGAKDKVTEPFNQAKSNYESGAVDGVVDGVTKRANENKSTDSDVEQPLEAAQTINDEAVRFSDNKSDGNSSEGSKKPEGNHQFENQPKDLSDSKVQPHQPEIDDRAKQFSDSLPRDIDSYKEDLSDVGYDVNWDGQKVSSESPTVNSGQNWNVSADEKTPSPSKTSSISPTNKPTSNTTQKNTSQVTNKPTTVTKPSTSTVKSENSTTHNKYDGYFN